LWLIALVIGVGWLVVQFYALAFYVEQEDKRLRVAWRNGLFTALASPIYTLILTLFVAGLLFLSVSIPALVFVGVPAVIALLANRAVNERLETFRIRTRATGEDNSEA
jgi:uncharacterized membrane protein YesL